MIKKAITRIELYDLVWSKPVTHIAKEYGFSDNGIRKICKKHNIPLPKSGYWSKLKFNKEVVKEKLPKQDNSPDIKLEKANPLLYEGNHKLSEIALRKKELERSKELIFKVPDKLSKPHKYIISTREYHKQLKIVKKRGGWSNEVDSTNTLSIDVSENLLSRGLRFLDSLIKLFEKRGYEVTVTNKSEVKIKKHTYSFRLTEKHKRIKKDTNYGYDTFDLIPAGILCLKVDRTYPIKEWSDTKTKLLEDKLKDILAWLELRAKEDEEQRVASELWQKQYQENLQKEKDLQKLKDEEFNKFESLFHTASRWHKSQYLRNYIKEFEEYAIKSNTLDSEKKGWIKWAKEKADWYDPFIEKELKLLEDIDRDTLKRKRKTYW